MIGFTRLALAIVIMAFHLTGNGGLVPRMAVLIFYVLAGYFATYSKVNYCQPPRAFFASRFIRLWACYLAVFALTFVLLLLSPTISPNRMGIPSEGFRVFMQSFMIVPFAPHVAIVPVAWMLKWMLLGYGAIALGAANTSRKCFIWLGFSFLLAQIWALSASPTDYYTSAAAAMLAFSVGASGYWLGVKLPRDGRWGSAAGAISYPLYLSHGSVEVAMVGAGFVSGLPLFFAALPLTMALSWMLVLWVERPISRYRAKLHG